MAYRIEFKPSAVRELAALERRVQVRIARKIDALAGHPRPAGAKKLAGLEDLWRIPVGGYRILYQIRDEVLLVLVVKIGHRGKVYR